MKLTQEDRSSLLLAVLVPSILVYWADQVIVPKVLLLDLGIESWRPYLL